VVRWQLLLNGFFKFSSQRLLHLWFNVLSVPVEDLVYVAEDYLVLAFHASRHRHFAVPDRLHVTLHQNSAFVNSSINQSIIRPASHLIQ